jgi:hypothetical protein
MSDQNEPVEPSKSTPETETDRLEGSYTERDGEAPEVREVPGQYVRTDGGVDDESVVGDYIATEEYPSTIDPSERRGKYIRTEPPKPHPGKQHT